MKIEFCIESIIAAQAAEKFGAHRIELCSDLNKDGLTPNKQLIINCTKVYFGETHIMIRPREGGFIYTDSEIIQMKTNISLAKKLNVKGVVFGALDKDNSIDIKTNSALVYHAKQLGLTTTFHRAFDYCKNPINSLYQIIDLKFDRLLSSGQEHKAEDGIDLLKKLKSIGGNKIEIMAGSGINEKNAELFMNKVDAIHFTVHNKNKLESDANYINTKKIEGIEAIVNSQ